MDDYAVTFTVGDVIENSKAQDCIQCKGPCVTRKITYKSPDGDVTTETAHCSKCNKNWQTAEQIEYLHNQFMALNGENAVEPCPICKTPNKVGDAEFTVGKHVLKGKGFKCSNCGLKYYNGYQVAQFRDELIKIHLN